MFLLNLLSSHVTWLLMLLYYFCQLWSTKSLYFSRFQQSSSAVVLDKWVYHSYNLSSITIDPKWSWTVWMLVVLIFYSLVGYHGSQIFYYRDSSIFFANMLDGPKYWTCKNYYFYVYRTCLFILIRAYI